MAIMPSVTRSRREPADKSGVETQIMDAVDRLLRRGEKYTEISVQRILTEAGLSRATFYSHFRDKVDLITRMVDKLRARLLGMADDLDFGDTEDGAARFSAFLLAAVRVQRSSAPLLAALREVATYDSGVRDFYFGAGHLHEELLHLCDRTRSFSYRITKSPLPWLNYVSGPRLWPVTSNNTTFGVWTGDWDASPQDDLNLIPNTEQNVYQKAFATVEKKLRKK